MRVLHSSPSLWPLYDTAFPPSHQTHLSPGSHKMKNSAEETEPRENRHGRVLGLFTGPAILPNLIHMLRALMEKQATRWNTWVMDAEMEILRGKRKGTPVRSLVPYTRAGTPTAQGLTHQQLFWDPQETRGNREPLPPRLGGPLEGHREELTGSDSCTKYPWTQGCQENQTST